MLKRIAFFVYGSFSYVIFLGTFLYALAFVGNLGVPTALDGAAQDLLRWPSVLTWHSWGCSQYSTV